MLVLKSLFFFLSLLFYVIFFVFLHFLVAHTETGWHKNWPIRNSLQQGRLQVNSCQGSHSKQKNNPSFEHKQKKKPQTNPVQYKSKRQMNEKQVNFKYNLLIK